VRFKRSANMQDITNRACVFLIQCKRFGQLQIPTWYTTRENRVLGWDHWKAFIFPILWKTFTFTSNRCRGEQKPSPHTWSEFLTHKQNTNRYIKYNQGKRCMVALDRMFWSLQRRKLVQSVSHKNWTTVLCDIRIWVILYFSFILFVEYLNSVSASQYMYNSMITIQFIHYDMFRPLYLAIIW
jgi:hypothetical protein